MFVAAIDYDPASNPALLAFLFVNTVFFDALALRWLLAGLERVSLQAVAEIDPDRVGSSGPDGGAPIWGLRRSTGVVAASVPAAMVGIVLFLYILILSPLAGFLFALTGAGVGAASYMMITAHRRERKAGPLAIPALTAHRPAGGGSRRGPLAYDDWATLQAAIATTGAGLIAIGAPLIAGPDAATRTRLAVVALLIWILTLSVQAILASLRLSDPVRPRAVALAMAEGSERHASWRRLEIGLAAHMNLGQIALEVARGSSLLIVGRNGAGKSHLLSRLAGRGEAWRGAVRLDEDGPLIDADGAAWLAASAALVSDTTPSPDVVVEPLSREVLKAALPVAGLPAALLGDDGSFACSRLSRAHRLRAGLALAMAAGRPLLLLDDFLTGQDPEFIAHFRAETLPSLLDAGCCIVLSSHDASFGPYVKRTLELDDGRLVEP